MTGEYRPLGVRRCTAFRCTEHITYLPFFQHAHVSTKCDAKTAITECSNNTNNRTTHEKKGWARAMRKKYNTQQVGLTIVAKQITRWGYPGDDDAFNLPSEAHEIITYTLKLRLQRKELDPLRGDTRVLDEVSHAPLPSVGLVKPELLIQNSVESRRELV